MSSNKKSIPEQLADEGKEIAKGVGREFLSIATLGLYKPEREGGKVITIKYPDGKVVTIRK